MQLRQDREVLTGEINKAMTQVNARVVSRWRSTDGIQTHRGRRRCTKPRASSDRHRYVGGVRARTQAGVCGMRSYPSKREPGKHMRRHDTGSNEQCRGSGPGTQRRRHPEQAVAGHQPKPSKEEEGTARGPRPEVAGHGAGDAAGGRVCHGDSVVRRGGSAKSNDTAQDAGPGWIDIANIPRNLLSWQVGLQIEQVEGPPSLAAMEANCWASWGMPLERRGSPCQTSSWFSFSVSPKSRSCRSGSPPPSEGGLEPDLPTHVRV